MLALPHIVKKVIENYIKELPNLEISNYVFQSRKGENMPITRQQAYRILNNATEMIGLVEKNEKGVPMSGKIGTHTLRKTFGYHAYQNESSLELLMDIFNHSSKSQTLRYILALLKN